MNTAKDRHWKYWSIVSKRRDAGVSDDTLPSKRSWSIKRGKRERAQAVTDPLAMRKPGWVLAEAKHREETRVSREWGAEYDREYARHAPLRDRFMGSYYLAGFRGATESRWVDGAGHTTTVAVCGQPRLAYVPGSRHPGNPGCASSSDLVWAKGGKCRSATSSEHYFCVRETWVEDVYDRGIAVLGGMLTLDASPVQCPGAVAYRAMWVRQGRGCSLVEEQGVILRLADRTEWVHSSDLVSAMRLAKRRQQAKRRRSNTERQAAREAAIARSDWAAVWPGVDLSSVCVSWADSVSAGNCLSGSQNWVARWLPGYEREECAPASVVLAAVEQDTSETRRLAVLAVHRAVHRAREARRQAARARRAA